MHTELLFAALAVLVAVFLSTRNLHPQFALAYAGGNPDDHPKKDEPKPWEALLMFKKGGGSAPSPDPNIGKAAMMEAQTGQDYLNFAKEQFAIANERQAEQDKLAAKVTNQQLNASKTAMDWAAQDRSRYQNTFVPLQDEFIKTAQNWDSTERQDKLAAEAKADVINNATQQRQATQRQMTAMGIDPTSGRYANIDRSGEMATGLAAAGAENTARNQVRKEAIALKGDAINLGSGLSVNPASSLGLGVSSGSAAYGTTAANNSQNVSNANIVASGTQTAMQGYGQQANILNSQFQNQLSAWQTQQNANAQNTAGLMGGIGSAAGMAMVAF